MRISLVHPSRGRAEMASKQLRKWKDRASGEHEIEHILCIDTSDIQLPLYKALFPFHNEHADKKIIIANNTNCVEATNRAAKEATGEMLIYFSDDFEAPLNWDVELVKQIPATQKEWCLRVRDGIPESDSTEILTIPIISRAAYEALGYFWYPEYKSMWCDNDLFWTYATRGWIKRCMHLVFEHKHWMNNKAMKDKTYQEHCSTLRYNEGKAIFERRKVEGFGDLKMVA